MRKAPIFLLLLAAAVMAPFGARAQTIQLITLTNQPWAYNDTTVSATALPLPDWTLPAYDTNAHPGWKTGFPLFGNDDAGVYNGAGDPFSGGLNGFFTPLDRVGGRVTFYFRVKFNWTGPAGPGNGVVLLSTNYLDDGNVLYLNGTEVGRIRVPAAPAAITWDTLGSNPPTESAPEVLQLPSDSLVAGENTLAVEVHQSGTGSSDVAFALDLRAIIPFFPFFTDANQPSNRVVVQSRSTTLSVAASASPPISYQWYFQPEGGGGFSALLDATNASYTIATMMSTDAGQYYCTVSNPVGSTNSRTATVGFNTDFTPPTVVRAVGNATFKTIVVEFNELLDPVTSQDSFNFDISGGLEILGNPALSPSGRSAIITLTDATPMAPDTDYTVTVSGVGDLALNYMTSPANIVVHSWVPTAAGGLVFEAFNGYPYPNNNNPIASFPNAIQGNAVANLTSHPSYPNNPSEVLLLPGLNTRALTTAGYETDTHDGYGARIRGLFFPPDSGNWIFYLSPDDGGELYLNPNGPDAAGKTLIAQQTGCCNAFTYNPGALSSGPIPLVAGQGYYIEGLYKEGIGGDYFQVAVALEGQAVPAGGIGAACGSCDDPSQVGSGAMPAGAAGTFTITQQPASAQVIAASTATFSVGVNQSYGLPVLYQWLRGGVPIAGANKSSYSFIPAIGDSGAVFSVAVTNLGGAGTISGNATLTVVQDTFAPTVVSSSIAIDGTSVSVTFSEGMDSLTTGDPFSYTINGTQSSSATLSADARTVTIVPASPLTTQCLANQIVISGVKDIAGNVIAPDPATITLTTPLVLVGNTDTQIWRFDYSGTDYDATWLNSGFDDSTWAMGPAPVTREDASTMPAGWPIRTDIADWTGARITTYFRTHFNLATDPRNITSLQLSEVIDDASVAYINGVEVHRLRVNAGPVVYATQANAGGTEPHPVEGPFVISSSSLVSGDNVLAIRVQQSGTTSSDIVMGAQLIGVVSSCAPALVATPVGGGNYRLTWSDPAYQLQIATDVTGPWVTQVGVVSGTIVPVPSTGNGFLRLIKP